MHLANEYLIGLEFADPGKIVGVGGGRIRNEDLTPDVVRMLLNRGVKEYEFVRKRPMFSLVDISSKETLYTGAEQPRIFNGYVLIGNEKRYEYAGRTMAVYPISEMRVPTPGENFDYFLRSSKGVGNKAVVSKSIMDFGEGVNNPDRPVVRVKLWQIYFDEQSRRQLDPLPTPYHNQHADKYLESSVIRKVWEGGEWRGHDFTGVISYAFQRKTGQSVAGIGTRMAVDDCKHDAYGVQWGGMHPTPHLVWNAMNNSHPRGSELAKLVLVDRLGYPEKVLRTSYDNAYANFYIYKSHVFDAYVHHMLLPVMQALNNEDDKEVYDLVNGDANYFKTSKMKREWLTQTFGRPYYTYHPFFCERLPGLFLKEFGYTQKLLTK